MKARHRSRAKQEGKAGSVGYGSVAPVNENCSISSLLMAWRASKPDKLKIHHSVFKRPGIGFADKNSILFID